MKQGFKHKIVFAIVGVTLVFFTLVMTVSYFHLKVQSESAVIENTIYTHHISMITNDISSPYWKEVYEGARAEAENSDTYIEMIGANSVEKYSVTDKTQLAVYEGTDGILVYPEQNDEMLKIINEAKENSIPVVTMQKDSSDSKRVGFVGNNDYFYGQALGKRILQMQKTSDHMNVSILVPNNTYTDANKEWLRMGVTSTIGEKAYTVSMSDVHETHDLIDAEDAINVILKSDTSIPNILICLDLRTTEIAYQILKDRGLDGTIRIIGNDISKTVVQGITEHAIDSVIMIDPEELGKKSVDAYLKYEKFGLVDNYTEVQTQLIDSDNAKEYLEKRENAEAKYDAAS